MHQERYTWLVICDGLMVWCMYGVLRLLLLLLLILLLLLFIIIIITTILKHNVEKLNGDHLVVASMCKTYEYKFGD